MDIKCINEVAPLVPDVIEIINLIKAADWAQVAIKAVELVSKGIPAVKECITAFKKEVNLGAYLRNYFKCLGLCKELPPEQYASFENYCSRHLK